MTRQLSDAMINTSRLDVTTSNSELSKMEVEDYVSQVRANWRNVGMAVAVVKGSEIVYAGGFGTRQWGESPKIDSNTLFQVGSTTKAFTTAAFAILVEEGVLRWDDPVVQYLPTFRLSDPWLTENLTLRDLLAHRGGIRDSLLPFLGVMNAEESIRQLRYRKPDAPFRDSFCYSNLMYAAAGRVLEVVTNMPWGQFVREKLLRPLKMDRSLTSPIECWNPEHVTESFFGSARSSGCSIHDARDSNVAMPHAWDAQGSRVILPWQSYNNAAAAGSLISSVSDMANWLILNVNEGRFCGRQLLSPGMIRVLHAPQNLHSVNQFPYAAETESYAMGWFRSEHAGQVQLEHGGGIIGFPAYMAVLPKRRVAVVVLSNGSQHASEKLTLPFKLGLNKSVAFWVFDRLLSLPPRDWSREFLTRARNEELEMQRQEVRVRATQLPNVPPSLPLEKYAGAYQDPCDGSSRVDICIGEGVLFLKFMGSCAYDARLEHWHQDLFRVRSKVGATDSLGGRFVTFKVDSAGMVESLSVADTTLQRMLG